MSNKNSAQEINVEGLSQASANQSVEQLVKEHGKFVKSFISKRVWDSQNVEDVYQITLMEALKSYHNFRNESHPRTWLCGIAYNVIRNYVRSMHVIESETLDVLESEEIDEGRSMVTDDPADIYHREEFISHVQEVTNELPVATREAFSLVVDSGKSYEQTAMLLDVPVGTIRSRISRAREVLRENCDL